MPRRPARPCMRPGCTGLVRDRVCSVCGPRKREKDLRHSSAQRGYDGRWRRLRARYLKQHSLCEDCEALGLIVLAVEVHHVVALNQGGKRLDWDNLRALCRSCHSKRTRNGE